VLLYLSLRRLGTLSGRLTPPAAVSLVLPAARPPAPAPLLGSWLPPRLTWTTMSGPEGCRFPPAPAVGPVGSRFPPAPAAGPVGSRFVPAPAATVIMKLKNVVLIMVLDLTFYVRIENKKQ
jgi:hypothetical protein